MERAPDKNTIWVVTGEPMAIRGGGPKELKVDKLSLNVQIFLEQMNSILEQTPDTVGKFQLDEFEVHAEVTAQGTIAMLGTGVQAGATGGLGFVFRRPSTMGNNK